MGGHSSKRLLRLTPPMGAAGDSIASLAPGQQSPPQLSSGSDRTSNSSSCSSLTQDLELIKQRDAEDEELFTKETADIENGLAVGSGGSILSPLLGLSSGCLGYHMITKPQN